MVILKKIPKILLCVTAWRLVSVFVVQTAHVPDEYWQALEVAHRLAFGYGYLTWEWREGIRSYVYPYLLSTMYRALRVFDLDRVAILTLAPRILQAVLSAYGDYRFYIWTKSKWSLFCLSINWYWYYCATRTLLNTLETSLTTIALSIFPWQDSNVRGTKYLWIVAVLCAMRPTAAIIWVPMVLYQLCTSTESKVNLVAKYLGIGLVTLTLSILVDSICYGRFVITPLRFLYANVIYQVGDFYGKQHSLWYITEGIPVVLGLEYLTFSIAVWDVVRNSRSLDKKTISLTVIVWTLCVYSMITHKEFRFILPLLPLFTYLSSHGIGRLTRGIAPLKRKIFLAIFVLCNVIPGIYFSLIHQRGSLDIMHTLQNEIRKSKFNDTSILFLTPCHATPFYSHLHTNVTAKFLTCEPNLQRNHHYQTEAQDFFGSPAKWLTEMYANATDMPSHVVLFDNLGPQISQFLKHYLLIDTKFYSSFPEGDYGHEIHVFKRKSLNKYE